MKKTTLAKLVVSVMTIALLSATMLFATGCYVEEPQTFGNLAMVKTLNSVLAKDEAVNGKPVLFSDALSVLAQNGYSVDKLTQNETNDYVWDSVSNRFSVYDKTGLTVYACTDTDVEKADFWTIISDKEGLKKPYGKLLRNDVDYGTDITVSTGIDVASNEYVETVNYVNDGATAMNSVISSNIGIDINVNAPLDTVSHYGYANSVNITAVAMNSYHEYGIVLGNLEIVKGRIEITASAELPVVLVSSAQANDVVIDYVDGAKVGTVAPTTDAAKTDVDAASEIPAEAKSDVVVTVNDNFAAGLGTERSPYLVADARQFKNIVSGTSTDKKYYKLVNDIVFTAEDEENGKYNTFCKAYHPSTVKYIDLDGMDNAIICESEGVVFDLVSSSTLHNIELNTKNLFIEEMSNATLIDIDVYGDISWDGGNHGVYVAYVTNGAKFENCNNYANINSQGDKASYNAIFVGYPWQTNQKLTFKNCNNYGKLVSGKASMFAANPVKATRFVIENCTNNGDIRATYMGSEYTPNCFVSVSEGNATEISFNGEIVGVSTTISSGFYHGPEDTMNLVKLDDGRLSFDKSQNVKVAYYVVSVGCYSRWIQDDAGTEGTDRFYATQRIESDGSANYVADLKVLSFVDATWVANNAAAVEGELAGNKTYTLGGVTYYLLNRDRLTTHGKVVAPQMITVSAYTADGVLVSSVAIV